MALCTKTHSKISSSQPTLKRHSVKFYKLSAKNKIKTKSRDQLNIEEELSENLGHKLQIDHQTASKGKISISYSSKNESTLK